MSANNAKRPIKERGTKDDESTDATGNYPKRGFSHWLWIAPPSCSFAEVARAYKSDKFDSPHDCWPDGNKRLDDFGGEN